MLHRRRITLLLLATHYSVSAFISRRPLAIHRQQAKSMVILGSAKGKAIREADDARTLKGLEEEYWKSLDPVSYQFARKQTIGVEMLKMGMLEESLKAFDEAIQACGDKYLFHRGLVLFILGKNEDAVHQLLKDAQIFEKEHDMSATDERLLAVLAGAKVENKELPLKEDSILRRNLYRIVTGDDSGTALLQIENSISGEELERDPMGRVFFADFYISLWHEREGRVEDAVYRMKRAAKSPFRKHHEIWGMLPDLIIKARCWE